MYKYVLLIPDDKIIINEGREKSQPSDKSYMGLLIRFLKLLGRFVIKGFSSSLFSKNLNYKIEYLHKRVNTKHSLFD